jgi:hypothetical protein
MGYLDTIEIKDPANEQMVFPVQCVNRPNSEFRGLSGTVAQGTMSIGDEVRVTASGQTAVVSDILTMDGSLDTTSAGDAITLTTGFAAGVKTLNLLGGNSISVFTTATVRDEMTVLNAGAFGGAIAATIADDKFDDTLTITGGSLTTDAVTAKFATANTYKGKTSGVETLKIEATNGANTAAAYVLSLENTTGVTKIEATVGDQDSLAITKMAAAAPTIIVKAADGTTGAPTVEAVLADATGSADSVSFELSKVTNAASIADTTILKTTDIETINLKISGNAETVSLASLGMTDATKFATLVVTGNQALTASAVNAAINTINASGMTTGGSFIQGGRSTTGAVTYTGSLGNDTFRMANGNDVIDGAAGTGDTLIVTGNLILGGIQVDLSASGDQVTTFNGSANAAIQKGFENINFSGITGTAAADITAIKTGSTIVGTSNADQITGGDGVDIITGGTGVDVMSGGGGNDIFVNAGGGEFFTASAAIDLIDGGAGTADAIRLEGATTLAATDLLARITNVEQITASATTGVISITATANAGGSTFTGTQFNTIDLSGDTNATGDNVVSITGITGITSITGSAGKDTITLGTAAVAATVTGGAGIDVLTVLATTTVVYANGDAAAAAAAVAGTNLAPLATGTFTGYETLTGLLTGSSLNLGNASLVVDAGTVGTVEANEYLIVQGAWTGNVFTAGGTGMTVGADSLILYDGSSAAGVQIQGIVLIGVTNTEEAAIVNTAGVLTVFG